jgi:hypothetical protein
MKWTREGHIPHSVFHGLRIDKKAEAIIREKPYQKAPGLEHRKGFGKRHCRLSQNNFHMFQGRCTSYL